MVPEGRRAADPSAPPPIAWPYERLGPVVIADNPCLAASSSFADPDFGNKAFTGREWDSETNLYYYRARYYDPKIGRFLGEDPFGMLMGRGRGPRSRLLLHFRQSPRMDSRCEPRP